MSEPTWAVWERYGGRDNCKDNVKEMFAGSFRSSVPISCQTLFGNPQKGFSGHGNGVLCSPTGCPYCILSVNVLARGS